MDKKERIHVHPTRRDRISIEPHALREFGIRLGIFAEDPEQIEEVGTFYLAIPDNPHIMFAKRIEFRQGGEGSLKIEEGGVVMMGHGLAGDGSEARWAFRGSGKGVSETVEAYEEYAHQYGFPPLDALIVCRLHQSERTRAVFTTRGIPYIFADSTDVTVLGGVVPHGREFTQGEGIENLVVEAGNWRGIERWRGYWDHAREFRRTRPIPEQLKQAAS